MKTIIEHGRIESQVRRFACRNCSCIFDATPDDYGFTIDAGAASAIASCPDCGKSAYTPELSIKISRPICIPAEGHPDPVGENGPLGEPGIFGIPVDGIKE